MIPATEPRIKSILAVYTNVKMTVLLPGYRFKITIVYLKKGKTNDY